MINMSSKKITTLFICFTLIWIKAFAQHEKGWFKHYEIGGEKSFFTSADIYSMYWGNADGSGIKLSAGNEFVIAKNFLIAPKIGVTYNFWQLLFIRGDFSLYNNFEHIQPVITPKIGIGVLGVSLFYGRNFNINKNTRFEALGRNQFGISFNFIPKVLFPVL